MRIKKYFWIIVTIIIVMSLLPKAYAAEVGTGSIETKGSLIEGKSIYFYIDPNCEYTLNIPKSIKRLVSPQTIVILYQ